MLTGQLLATGPVYLSVFAALSLHSVCLICVCALVLRIVYLVLLCCIKLMLLTIISIMTTLFSLQTKLFFSASAARLQKKMLSLFSFVPLTSREITICLIVGDTHTPQELGCTQIIRYTSLPSFFLPLYFSAALSVFSSPFPSFSTPPSSLVIEVAIHQIATSVRCQHPLINDSYERILNE